MPQKMMRKRTVACPKGIPCVHKGTWDSTSPTGVENGTSVILIAINCMSGHIKTRTENIHLEQSTQQHTTKTVPNLHHVFIWRCAPLQDALGPVDVQKRCCTRRGENVLKPFIVQPKRAAMKLPTEIEGDTSKFRICLKRALGRACCSFSCRECSGDRCLGLALVASRNKRVSMF